MFGAASKRAREPLTKESFERLLSWLDGDREAAGQKYEEIRGRLIKLFMSRGCTIAEELADETINRVARKAEIIADNYVGDPALYFYGVARMVYLESIRSRPVQPPIDAEASSKEADERFGCLQRCLDLLTPSSRTLILEYYREDRIARTDHRTRLAEKMGVAPNALWVRAHRIRQRLRKCVIDCMRRGPAREPPQ